MPDRRALHAISRHDGEPSGIFAPRLMAAVSKGYPGICLYCQIRRLNAKRFGSRIRLPKRFFTQRILLKGNGGERRGRPGAASDADGLFLARQQVKIIVGAVIFLVKMYSVGVHIGPERHA